MKTRKLTKEQLKSLVVEARSDIFSDRWRGGEGMGSAGYPEAGRDGEGYGGQTTFSEGETKVLEGITLMKDGLEAIDNPKVKAAIVRLLDQMIGQVESIKDAYQRLVREQEGS
jgi:hypothetical protein